jgi:peptidoglycan/LPS O-acetylase OafA/YrhL
MSAENDLQTRLTQRHIPGLDGMRALAVFLVIFYHFGFSHVPGGNGVMIFFVLSGFLITWLLLQEDARTGSISLTGFYRRRFLRIFPAFDMYWILVVILLYVTHKHIPWGHAFSALFYVTDYYNASQGDPNTAFSHTWSLAIEEQFYLLWPLLFLRFHHNLKSMTRFLVGLILAVWIYRVFLCFVVHVNQGWIYAAFDTRMDHLAIGCLVAVLLKRSALMSFWKTVCAHPALPLITIGLLVLSIYDGGLLLRRYRDVVGFALEPVLIAVLLVQVVSLSANRIWSWIEWPALRFLGRISYSLYLYQQLILFSVRKRLSGEPLLVQLFAAVLVTTLVASASYFIIERPFLKLKRGGDVRLVKTHDTGNRLEVNPVAHENL